MQQVRGKVWVVPWLNLVHPLGTIFVINDKYLARRILVEKVLVNVWNRFCNLVYWNVIERRMLHILELCQMLKKKNPFSGVLWIWSLYMSAFFSFFDDAKRGKMCRLCAGIAQGQGVCHHQKGVICWVLYSFDDWQNNDGTCTSSCFNDILTQGAEL